MEAAEIQNVCRLCPADQFQNENSLINVFDNNVQKNMMEVILVTTGIQISECDIISKKICNKCYDNVLKVNDIRQIALKQDQNLKKKCQQYLSSKGIRLPNSCITIRKDYHVSTQDDNKLVSVKTSSSSEDVQQAQIELPCDGDKTYFTPSDTIDSNDFERPDPDKDLFSASLKHLRLRSGLHPSVIDVYRKYPTFKLPGKCFYRNLAPIVSLVMGEVETYFRKHKLDMNDFIYKPMLYTPLSNRSFVKQVAKKRTAAPFKASPLLSSISMQNNEDTEKSVIRHATDSIVFSDCIPYDIDSKTYTTDDATNTTSKCNSPPEKPTKRSHKNKNPIVQRQQKMRFSKLKSLCNSLKAPIKKVSKVSKLNKSKDKSFAHSPNSTKFSSVCNESLISRSTTFGFKSPNIADNSYSTIVEPCQDQNPGSLKRTSNGKCRTEIGDKHDKPALVSKSKAKSSKILKGKSLLKKNVSKKLAKKLEKISKNKHSCISNSVSNSSMCKASSSNDGQSKLSKLCKKSDYTLAVKHNKLRTAADSILATKTSQSVISTGESSVPSTSKPEFIQSLGLTPALSLSNTLNIFACKLCGSQHNSAVALNKHVIRHRTCPFCKLKFKYGENKPFHVEHNCAVRRIITASESAVDFKKPGPNSALKKAINDVLKRNQKSSGSNRAMDDNNVIILTDDEDVEFISENESQNMLNTKESQEPTEESVSIVRPIISICNNTILDTLGNKLTDKNLVKNLVMTFRHASISTEEKGCYTESVTHQEPIFIKNQSCRLKSLHYDLFSYMVPVMMKNGNFDVSFCSKSEKRKFDASAQWTALPIVNKPTLKPVHDIPIMNTTYPLTFVTSQVQSSQLSLSSIQLMTTSTPTMSIFLPNAQSFLPSSSVSIQPSLNNTVPHTQTINNTFFSPIQSTPLLQNYTLSMTPLPIINNQVSVQTNNSTAKESNSVSDTTIVSSSKSKRGKSPSTVTPATSTNYSQHKDSKLKKINKKTVPASFPNKKLKQRKTKRKKQTRTRQQSTKVKVGNLAPQSSKSSKLRVKNLWELK